MPGVLDRVNARYAAATRGRPQALSLDEYASWFSYGGTAYPFMQTTYSTMDQERVPWTASHAAKMSGPVFSLIYLRMRIFSQIRFQWTRLQGALPSDLFGTSELKVLERPWPGGTTSDLLARMEWDASTAGIGYVRRKGSTLHRLNPAWVTVVMGSQEDAENPAMAADTTLAGFLWRPPGGQMKYFTPQQVAYYAPVPDPDAHFLGESWIAPVMRELQGDAAAVEHKWRFFENGAMPNQAIAFDPTVGIDAVRQFKELMESEHRGVANAWKTLFLGGGAKPVAVGSSFKDMDYAVVQGRAESRLAAAAGVHPTVAGFSEGLSGSSLNAGNYSAARRLMAESTLTHLWGNAASSLEPLLAVPPGASLWPDTRIPFMREDASDQASIQSTEALTIGALIRDGFVPATVVKAVQNNDWTLLKHSGLTSVQLVPPSSGEEPVPGFLPAPAAVPSSNGNGNGAHP